MMQLRALDLFCSAGGSTRGLQRAGFHVTGVDIKAQPRYVGDVFIQADALNCALDFRAFDFIWASPPCQRFSALTKIIHRGRHPDLIDKTRDLLVKSGTPFVIENVVGAPIRRDLVLDGDMFGLGTYRRRAFELSFFVLQPPPNPPFGPETRPGSVTVTDGGSSTRTRVVVDNGRTRYRRKGTTPEYLAAMGIDWMTRAEVAEAVPPSYAEFIARAWLAQRQEGNAA
jgi:DNA (cytosine-5)-methyltransferase 1